MASDPLPFEGRLGAGAEKLQRPLLADRVRSIEYPVLPGREAAEDARLHRLGPGEAEIGLEARQRVGRQARALLDGKPDLVLPIELVRREGDETQIERRCGVEFIALVPLERRLR